MRTCLYEIMYISTHSFVFVSWSERGGPSEGGGRRGGRRGCWVLAESYVRLKLLPQRLLCFLHDTHVESPTRPNQRNKTTDRRSGGRTAAWDGDGGSREGMHDRGGFSRIR